VDLKSDARQALRRILQNRTLEADLRSAAAVGLGLMGAPETWQDLRAAVANPANDADLRADAALALGQLAVDGEGVVAALERAAIQEGPENLRGAAALGLSLFGRSESVEALIAQLRGGRRTAHLAGVTLALGHLGSLDAVEPLLEVARDEDRPELVRAMALVALGVLTDPEARPSLLRLSRGSPYPVRTSALEEAFTIL
jgi:HEAT repeat protein